MDNFADYYNVAKKDFSFTIKLARNGLGEDTFAKLENKLQKYNLKSMSPIKKTPIQLSPLDFPNVRSSEVYITEVVLEYPVAPDSLLREIASSVELNESEVAVYTENDPRHTYTEQVIDRTINSKEYKDRYETALGNPEKWDEEPAYGEKYTTEFLKALSSESGSKLKTAYYDSEGPAFDDETTAEAEKAEVNVDSVLKDRWKDASKGLGKQGKNTMMSRPSKES